MRTTFDVPEELLEEARRLSGARSKREAVLAGLEELIRKGRREELRQLAGRPQHHHRHHAHEVHPTRRRSAAGKAPAQTQTSTAASR